jgi:hypothetical protein
MDIHKLFPRAVQKNPGASRHDYLTAALGNTRLTADFFHCTPDSARKTFRNAKRRRIGDNGPKSGAHRSRKSARPFVLIIPGVAAMLHVPVYPPRKIATLSEAR